MGQEVRYACPFHEPRRPARPVEEARRHRGALTGGADRPHVPLYRDLADPHGEISHEDVLAARDVPLIPLGQLPDVEDVADLVGPVLTAQLSEAGYSIGGHRATLGPPCIDAAFQVPLDAFVTHPKKL